MPAKPPKKRNPTDATLRNVRATAKRLDKFKGVVVIVDSLSRRVRALESEVKALQLSTLSKPWLVKWVGDFDRRIKALEAAAVDAIYLEGRGKRR